MPGLFKPLSLLTVSGRCRTDATSLIIDLISGAVGGNAAGAAMPDKSLKNALAAKA